VNTALAAEYVAKKGDKTLAAIASEDAAERYGLEIAAQGINENRNNTTRFAVVSRVRNVNPLAKGSDMRFILMFTVRNEAGSLARAIDIIGRHGYNMGALRSRPMKELLWQYYFYVEAEGNIDTYEGRAMMNIHVKIWDMIRISTNKNIDPKLYEIAALIKNYVCEKHVYFMSTNTEMLCRMREILPEAGYCQGAGEGNEKMVEAAIENRFDKVQFVKDKPYSKEMIDLCHRNGIRCNMFWSDDPEEARRFLEMGIDCILTNDYQRVFFGVKDLMKN
jgi:hypothetical protein